MFLCDVLYPCHRAHCSDSEGQGLPVNITNIPGAPFTSTFSPSNKKKGASRKSPCRSPSPSDAASDAVQFPVQGQGQGQRQQRSSRRLAELGRHSLLCGKVCEFRIGVMALPTTAAFQGLPKIITLPSKDS